MSALDNGARLHLVDGEAWAVLVDVAGAECSARVGGTMHFAFDGPGRVVWIFHPDDWDTEFEVTARECRGPRVAIGVEGDAASYLPTNAKTLGRGGIVRVDWRGHLSRMA